MSLRDKTIGERFGIDRDVSQTGGANVHCLGLLHGVRNDEKLSSVSRCGILCFVLTMQQIFVAGPLMPWDYKSRKTV